MQSTATRRRNPIPLNVRGEIARIGFLILLLALEVAVSASYLLGANVTSFGFYPGIISTATLVLPTAVGALFAEREWALVVHMAHVQLPTVSGTRLTQQNQGLVIPIAPLILPVVPLWFLLVIERVVWGPLFLSWLPIALLSVLFAVLGLLGWLARIVASYDSSLKVAGEPNSGGPGVPSDPCATGGRQLLRNDGARMLVISGALLAEGAALLWVSLKANPLVYLPHVLRPTSPGALLAALAALLSRLLPWCALLVPPMVLGALARRRAEAVVFAISPFWLLMSVYMLVFAPSWFLDLAHISNLTGRMLLTFALLGGVALGGWWGMGLPKHTHSAQS